MENGIPEGFILVNEKEYKDCMENLKNIERAVNNGRRSNVTADITRIIKETTSKANNNRGAKPNTQYSQGDLVTLMQTKCQDTKNSLLRSKLETTKCKWMKGLKKAVGEQQTKQRESQKKLKERFVDGQKEINTSYNKELMDSFKNTNALNNSLPVEQYACDELIRTYRENLTKKLLPEMDQMYKAHCLKIDGALKGFVAEYTSSLMPVAQSSPAVKLRLQAIQARISRISNSDVNGDAGIRLENAVDIVTRSLADFAVQSSPRELTNEEKIESALQAEDFNEALHQALLALDVQILLATCHRIPVDDLFAEPLPDQSILLSLLNQMQNNIEDDIEVKSNFLQQTIRAILLDSPTVQGYFDKTLIELTRLINHIDDTRRKIAPSLFNKHLKPLSWVAAALAKQINQYYQ